MNDELEGSDRRRLKEVDRMIDVASTTHMYEISARYGDGMFFKPTPSRIPYSPVSGMTKNHIFAA